MELAANYEITDRQQLIIDGKPFPWHIAEPGPMVEPISDGDCMHTLWVPIMVAHPMPAYGTPVNAEPVATEL